MSLSVIIANGITTQGTNPPFEIGGNLYQIVLDGDNAIFGCFKSTDQGATWIEQDVAGSFPNSATVFTAACDGTKIFLFYTDDATQNIAVAIFNTATDTWISNTVSALSGTSNNSFYSLFRAADNKIVCAAPVVALAAAPNRSRSGYFLYDIAGGTFGPWVPIGETNPAVTESWLAYVIVQGNGCMHLCMIALDNDGLGGGSRFLQQSLSDANALGAIQVVDTIPANYPSMFPIGYGDGTNIAIGWGPVDFPNNSVAKIFTGVSGLGPIAFTTQTIDTVVPNTFFQAAIIIVAGVLYVLLYSNDGGTDYILRQFKDSGAGFDAGTVLDTEPSFKFCRWINLVSFFATGYGLLVDGTVSFFIPGSAPATGGLIRLQIPQPTNLPDPKILCNYSAPKLCGEELDCRNYTMQGTKGLFGEFK